MLLYQFRCQEYHLEHLLPNILANFLQIVALFLLPFFLHFFHLTGISILPNLALSPPIQIVQVPYPILDLLHLSLLHTLPLFLIILLVLRLFLLAFLFFCYLQFLLLMILYYFFILLIITI